MDSLTIQYRQIIKNVLVEYADFFGNDAQVKLEVVLDEKNDHYLLVETGWENGYRIYGCLLHFDLIDGKVWIQHDGTEEGVANDLVAAGISKSHIILGFKAPEVRKYTEFAVS
ncbi:fdxN element excision controlling factor protein [Richelia sinica FACHB-800]|uniref:FdxN element excision controlling factor protein n=1 Tax=Richelia sinica FACHB-800 TaxID=1357546 RepID=A0A975TAM1_9NOST|nr:XisI protein [Richelia sinica]MBD2663346.1 XisI protein [Richelia sinica FACHB-800]QXE24518.1 fdxN element excision controlling factor protein [Richelia sinica FACHB-800]